MTLTVLSVLSLALQSGIAFVLWYSVMVTPPSPKTQRQCCFLSLCSPDVRKSNSPPLRRLSVFDPMSPFEEMCVLTFIYPCIATTSLKYNQQDATFSRSAYSYKLLYMFQAVPPPIIRSTELYIQRQVLSNQYCCYCRWDGTQFHFIHDSSSIGIVLYCIVLLLMMGGGTAWNM